LPWHFLIVLTNIPIADLRRARRSHFLFQEFPNVVYIFLAHMKTTEGGRFKVISDLVIGQYFSACQHWSSPRIELLLFFREERLAQSLASKKFFEFPRSDLLPTV
jgi:hypothetical protein